MNMPLGEIAQLIDGQIQGNAAITISGAAIIRDARVGDITLADAARLQDELSASSASAVVVPPDFQPAGMPYITVDDVHASFAKIVSHFRPPRRSRVMGVSPAAHVGSSASVGRDTVIHPGATIGEDVQLGARCNIHSGACLMDGVQVGDDVVIFPNAVLYENTRIGDRVIIHANAVIGGYGFGYETVEGRPVLSAQLGFVQIEDDVEIGSAATIDRGTYGPTTIGAGTKIDNQVQIAHNCRIGKNNLICALVGIAGSCTTGDSVVMAGQVGLRDHTHIGQGAMLGGKSGVMQDVPPGAAYVGIPATPEREQFAQVAALAKLPQMRKQLRSLEKDVAKLRGSLKRDAA